MRNIDILLEMVLFQIFFGKICLRRAAIQDKSGRDLSVQVTADVNEVHIQGEIVNIRAHWEFKSSVPFQIS